MVYTEYKQTGFYPERMFSMNKAMIFFGIAAAVGTGYILAKKYIYRIKGSVFSCFCYIYFNIIPHFTNLFKIINQLNFVHFLSLIVSLQFR